jgi:hypothetical protein
MDGAIFVTGDLKWLAMLLGMEDMSTYWCIHCMLGKAGFQDADHAKGDPRTIERMAAIRELYGIDDPDSNMTKNGVKAKPFWDFIAIENYCLPLLHIWMGVFNDVDKWFMSKVDGFVWKSETEKLIQTRLVALDAQIDEAVGVVEKFKDAKEEGKTRSRLLTRRSKNLTRVSQGKPVDPKCPPLTDDEERKFLELESVFAKITAARDALKKKHSLVAKELLDYHSEMKKDRKSIFGVIEQHWESNEKYRAAYHGGSWNGIDSRDCMRNPEKYYGSMRQTLLKWKDPSKSDEEVNSTIDNVKDLLGKWHEVFHLLRAPKRKKGTTKKLRELIKVAIAKHRELGLSITHKVHLIEDHVVEQFKNLPFAFFYFIEEFVERNHQEGKKNEDIVKRVKNEDKRAIAKAKRQWVARGQGVRRYMRAVADDGKRGAYKKRHRPIVEVTPPVFDRPESTSANTPVEFDRLLLVVTTATDHTPRPQKQQKTGVTR